MARLGPSQVAQVAWEAGFTGDGLVWAVAVSMAEDGSGNPSQVYVNTDGSRDRGLWQINDRWHPDVSDAQAFSPSGCAAAAYKISSGGSNWSPWSTYQNGRARAQYAAAQKVVAAMGGVSSSSGQPAAPGGGNSDPAIAAGIPTNVLDGWSRRIYPASNVPYAQLTPDEKKNLWNNYLKNLVQAGQNLGMQQGSNTALSNQVGIDPNTGQTAAAPWDGLFSGVQKDIYEGAIYFGVLAMATGLVLVGAWAAARKA